MFTRATTGGLPAEHELAPGVVVRHVTAGPYEGLGKQDLPGQLCAFAAGVMRAEAARPEGWYDLVHSHYWLSGQVGWLAADRWRVPLVHTMHTMARVKNAQLADGDTPEPPGREIGEAQVVEAADRLVANTDEEARQLVELYDADPARCGWCRPGSTSRCSPPATGPRPAPRLGLPADARVLLFVGRIQPLKAPDVLLRAAADLLRAPPGAALRPGRGRARRPQRHRPGHTRRPAAAGRAGWGSRRRSASCRRSTAPALVQWYRSADLVAVPSYNESFGLVAVEAQASGTPVVAAAVGGLPTAVGDAGVLVPDHETRSWSTALEGLLDDDARRAELAGRAVRHAVAVRLGAHDRPTRLCRGLRRGARPGRSGDRVDS